MKNTRLLSIITFCLLLLALTAPASAFTTPEGAAAAGKVYVSSVTFDPAAFYADDTGTVTFAVTNSNTNQSVVVNHATFSDTNIKLTSGTYDTSSNIGPLQTRTFVFSVAAKATEGTYYPTFSLSFRDADSLYYRSMVQVNNAPIILTVLDKPDAFTRGKKDTIYLQVANPRNNDVKNVILEVSGDGTTATPSKRFIGSLASGATIPVNFSVTPDQVTILTLKLHYDNGDNPHTITLELPITFAKDKKQANPVVSNVQVKNDAGVYHVTGDVTNAGLETANSVTVTSLAPAVPQDPYRTYVVGVLKPDDFGSFEVTFSVTDSTSVSLQLSYKDADGNIYTSIQDVNLSAAGAAAQNQKGSLPLLPIAVVVIVIAVFVGGWFLYLKRNKK